VLRICNHFCGGSALDESAAFHDRDAVAETPDYLEVVGYQDQGELELLPQVRDQIEDLRLDRHVEGGYGLVEDQEPRFRGQSAGDRDPLAFAARKLRGVAPRGPFVQTDLPEHAVDDIGAIRGTADAVCCQRFGNNFRDAKAWIKRCTRILKNRLKLAPQGPDPGFRQLTDRVAPESDGSPIGSFEGEEETGEGGFAGT
jgi:hypothetical protein